MVTVKITEDARALLRILAAHKGRAMHEVAEDLFWTEAKRLDVSAPSKLVARMRVKNGSGKKEKR